MPVSTADPVSSPTVADLGRLVKRKYPSYANIPDADLGRRVKAKYPAYARFTDIAVPPQAAPIRMLPSHAPEAPRRAIASLRSTPEAPPAAVAGPGSPPEFVRGFRGGLVGQNVEAVGRTLQAASQFLPSSPRFPVGAAAGEAGGALIRAGQAQAQAPKQPDIFKVRSAREFFDFVQFAAGQAIASTVPTVVGGAVGTVIGGPGVGAAVGAGGPGYALNFGDVSEEVDQAFPNAGAAERAQVSAIITVPIAAMDAIPGMKFGSKAAKRLMVQKILQQGIKSGLLKRVLVSGGKGMTLEGGTELVQEVGQALMVASASGKKVPVDDLITRAVNAGIGGMLAGGAIGGAVEAIPQRKGAAPGALPDNLRPSVLDEIGARANIATPPTLPDQMRAAGNEASAEVGNAVVEMQRGATGPIRFEVPGLTIEDAHVIPNLIRVFPGDPNAVRITVLDKATGRIHSLGIPNIGALRDALGAAPSIAPVAEPKPRRAEKPTPPRKRTREEYAADVEAERLAGARKETAPKAIAALERQIAERPGDARVGRWKRRLEKLKALVPEPVPAVEPKAAEAEKPSQVKPAPRQAAQPKPAPPPTPPPTRADVEVTLRAASEEAGVAPKVAAEHARAALGPIRRTTTAPPSEAPARMLVPNMQFRDERSATRVAAAIARSEPGSDPEVVRTRRGYEIQINEEALQPAARPEPVSPAAPERRGVESVVQAVPGRAKIESRRKMIAAAAGAERQPSILAPLEGPSAGLRSFIEEFEALARQGRTLEEATAEAKARSGSDPPAGLDLEARWSRVRRDTQEAEGQTDMFGGAAMLGRPAGQRTEADIDMPERVAPPPVPEAAARAEKPSEAKDVTLEGLWYWQGFQNRDVKRGTPPTQDPGELIKAAHVKMLSETSGGFDLDEVVRRPILVWRDAAGELGETGRRYVIDGHHRAYMAKEAGAKKLPAVEVFGDLAYARGQARLSNLAAVPNTFYEKARIARELRDRGDEWERVAAQVRVSVGRAKGMVDFAHLDPGVRNVFFPPGDETTILNTTAHGETVGRYARESPELMTVNMQHQWLSRAVDDDISPSLFAVEVRNWHLMLKAAKQEIMDLGAGVQGVRLSMTPRQFADTSGRLIAAIDSKRRQAEAGARGLESVAEMARGEGHDPALEFVERKLVELGKEHSRLAKAKKEIDAAIHEALMAGMRGERDLPASFDAIQKRVDEIVGPDGLSTPLVGEGGVVLARRGDFIRAIIAARRRLSGIARRDPVARQAAKGPPPPSKVVKRILEALKAARPVREQQEAGYTAERIRRIRQAVELERGKAGLEQHYARLAALKGAYKQVDFESIAKALSQEDVNDLVKIIFAHPSLEFFDKPNAVIALQKLLGEEGGEVPQRNELELLEIVFGTEFVEALTALRPKISEGRILGALVGIGNVSRAMRTSFDLSGALRQGLYLGPSFPKEWSESFVAMHRYWASEENFRDGMEAIYHDPAFRLARRSGLSLSRPGSQFLDAQEEPFYGANLAENLHKPIEKLIPGAAGRVVATPLRVVSSGVRRSNRSYAGFLNKLRFDVFKALIAEAMKSSRAIYVKARASGLSVTEAEKKADYYDPWQNPELARGLAEFVNAGTGRGDSQLISKNSGLLNFFLFAPRLIKSRLHLLNIKHYVRGHPLVRRQYIRSSAATAGTAALVLTLAAWAGAQVEWERRNGDWGKIRVGGTVYDILGGFVQYLRLYATVAETLLNQARGRRLRYGNAAEILLRFTEHKLAPVPQFILGWLRGQATERDIRGRRGRFKIGLELLKLFVPMVAEDFFEVMKKDPRQLPVTVPASVYGVSVQSYRKPRR